MKRTSESLLVLTKPLRMRALKMPRADYNSIPDGILLIPGKDVVVGRSSEASHVALRSSKLPAMLSRRHAVLSYSSTDKHWLVEDLKSVNGVYVNDVKIQPGIPNPLKIGDKICFGVNVEINEFKYLLVIEHGQLVLKRLVEAGVRKPKSDPMMILIHLAQSNVEMNRSLGKHALCSSIVALKRELASKEQLVAKKEEKESVSVKTSTGANDSMLSSIKEEFTCVICKEMFVNAYTLPCAHSFCELCIRVWMNGKRRKDCPICRKEITSNPVRSLALDNAITKLVARLGSAAKEEREALEKSHAEDLNALNAAMGATQEGSSVLLWSISDPDESAESFDSEDLDSSEEPFLD